MSMTSNIGAGTPLGIFLKDIVKPVSFSSPPIIVEHIGDRWGLIGTAFDYRVRMGISIDRNCPFIPRIADSAVAMRFGVIGDFESLKRRIDAYNIFSHPNSSLERDLYERMEAGDEEAVLIGGEMLVFEIPNTDLENHPLKQVERSLETDGDYFPFRDSVIGAIENKMDDIFLSKAALRFAQWDTLFRQNMYNEDWNNIVETDAEEIEELYQIWREKFHLLNGELLLNPNSIKGVKGLTNMAKEFNRKDFL